MPVLTVVTDTVTLSQIGWTVTCSQFILVTVKKLPPGGNMNLSKCSEFIKNSLLASLVTVLIEFNYVEVSSLFL